MPLEYFTWIVCLTLICGTSQQALPFTSTTSTYHVELSNPVNLGKVIPASFFGMHVLAEKNWADTPKGFGSRRLWDTGVTWADIEPIRDQWNFAGLDRQVRETLTQSADVLLTLGQTPKWATSQPSVKGNHGFGSTAPPASIADWENYVRVVVERYKGRIAAYEIWNEPYYSGFYTGTVQQLVDLSSRAYKIIKEIDPHAVVASPSCNLRWLDGFLEHGGGSSIDVISYHLSPTPAQPEDVLELASKVYEIMAKHGAARLPLWNTENSWGPSAVFTSDKQAAAYVARAYIMNWLVGVQRLYWYAWDNDNYVSLKLTDSNRVPTPAGAAYREIETWLVGSVLKGCNVDGQVWRCDLNRNGLDSWLIWSTDGIGPSPASLGLPINQVQTLAGNFLSLPSLESVTISDNPILATAARDAGHPKLP